MPSTVIYHADCLDGFAAAYAAWLHLGEQACYRPMHHGETLSEKEIAGHTLYILDFSFPPEVLLRLSQHAQAIIQIDHHLSAWKECAQHFALTESPCDFTHPKHAIRLIFDLDYSGSHLAWRHFQGAQKLPLALQHIEENDLWRFTHPNTRAFCRALRLKAFDFQCWHRIILASQHQEAAYREAITQGQTLDRFLEGEVLRLAQSAQVAYLRGEPIDALQALRHDQATLNDGTQHWLVSQGLAVNAPPLFASELGHQLALRSGSWGMTWHYNGGEIKVSLRSCGHCDVAEIARRYGGGGHKNAAGFRLDAKKFLNETLGKSR